MKPLLIEKFTATSCIGTGLAATLQSLIGEHSGLERCEFETVAIDTYPLLENVHESLADYDQVVKTYYDLRDPAKPVGTFTRQIETKPGGGRAEQAPVREVLDAQRLALY